MKSRQLLSVVFSLIMFTGVTAGNTAFAESDDYDELDDKIEDYCELSIEQQEMLLSDFPELADYTKKLEAICEIENEDEREDALEEIADIIVPETDEEDIIDSFEDCVEAGYPVMESYPEKCMTDDGTSFTNTEDDDDDDYSDDDRYADGDKFYVCHNDKAISIAESAVRAHLAHGDSMGRCHDVERDYEDVDRMHDKYSNKGPGNLRDHFAMFCDMTAEEREKKMASHHDDLPDDLRADLARYCEMSEDEQDDFRDTMMDKMDMMRDHMKKSMHTEKDMRHSLEKYCDMSESDRDAYIEKHDKDSDKAAKMDSYCTLDESGKTDFIAKHLDEYRAYKMDKMSDKKHMDYDRLCAMSTVDIELEVTDVDKLERITEWCNMTPEERDEYKMKHHDGKDKMREHCTNAADCPMESPCTNAADCPMESPCTNAADCPMDRMSDMAKERMSDVAKDKHHENKMKFSEKSDRLKAMIMDKHDISDERHDEIRMKFEAKHGEDSDKKRTEIKMKYKDHMLKMKFKMSDERKSDVHERLTEMKAYKAELRESSEMTDEEKQQLREDFIEKAKDMQLAWITPRTQMTAGIDAAEVECREGYSLVMKESNGVAMCLKADTALKMIDRGTVVPAN